MSTKRKGMAFKWDGRNIQPVRVKYVKIMMNLNLILVSSTQSRASLVFNHSASTFIGCSSSRSLSVCSFYMTLQPNKLATNCLILSAMSNARLTRCSGIHHQAGGRLSQKRRSGSAMCRNFSTCSVSLISPVASLIVRPPSSRVVASSHAQNDMLQRSDEWFALRRDKLTTSTFSTALGFWKGNRRSELWHDKVFSLETQVIEDSKRCAMEWGVLNEAVAIDRYKSITGRDVSSLGFAVHAEERLDWLGASPDGLLGCFPGGGILEVKCPYNKGKPEIALPWSTLPFYYMPQVQGQMEIMNREWVDLYCWTPNGSSIFRVIRERDYWVLIHDVLREFWWGNVVPAKVALSMGREEEAKSYNPTPTHKLTGLAIVKSRKLASESKLLCKEIAGHVEFFR